MRASHYRHCHSAPVKQVPAAVPPAAAEQAADRVGRFLPGEVLGSGTFSVVKLAVHTGTGRRVALKILSKRRIEELGTEERVGREIRHLRLCAAHPHLARLYDVVDTPKSTVLATEYVSGGELFDHVSGRRLDADEARGFFQQIVSGVEFMHYKRVVHRDLKLENILLDANRLNVKIVDFGLSSYVREGEMMRTACGSPHYAAPEIISGKPYVGYGVDVWSIGIILYALLCGALPFHEEDMKEQFQKIKSGIYSIPMTVPAGSRALIRGMIEVDTEKRMTIASIRRHHWFRHKLPPYLQRSPDVTEKEERLTVDPRILDEVVRLYDSAVLPHGANLREVLKKVVAHESHDGVEGEEVESIRDMRCAYNLILDDRHYREHSVELTRQTKGRFSFGSLLGRVRKLSHP